MTTYTDTKEFTLTTEWKQFRVPFDEFKILDGGSNLDCARVRGFIFSSAENSGEGSFMIDNITHTSIKGDIEWGLPTPTPEPTPTPLPDPVTVTTAEQLAAIKDIRQRKGVLLGNFHSHPESPSRPSQEDIRLAYDPKMNYLILSLMNPEELVLNSFHIEKGEVTKEELVIEA